MDKYIKVETVKGIIRQVCFGLALDEETEKALIDAIDEIVSKSGKDSLIKEQTEWIFNSIKSKMDELYDISAYNEKKFNGEDMKAFFYGEQRGIERVHHQVKVVKEDFYKIFNDEG